jgi:hypothetical protein
VPRRGRGFVRGRAADQTSGPATGAGFLNAMVITAEAQAPE